ncbi:MAG: hypothetical protein GY822_18115 [Deltaproteobacteria bacterium]|nr:hypothetical protein [Deltaproteobacteria bacterium]
MNMPFSPLSLTARRAPKTNALSTEKSANEEGATTTESQSTALANLKNVADGFTSQGLKPTFASVARTPATLQADLLNAWETHYKTPVGDADLAPGIDVMFKYLHGGDYFRDRLDGIHLDDNLGPNKDLDFLLVPNRNRYKPAGGCACPFCSQPDPIERGLNWRNYQVLANSFPYAPKASNHIVIATETHVPQSFSSELLGDMIDFQKLQSNPVSMHYNGIAGNSQKHFHWHATAETYPLQTQLDDDKLPLKTLRETPEGRVCSYEQGADDKGDPGFYRGILLEGNKEFVSRWATRIVDKMNKDPVVKKHYNMLLLKSDAGKVRLVIIPRNARPDGGKIRIGALGVAGRGVLVAEKLPDDAVDNMRDYIDESTARPSDLAWLKPLVQTPKSGALFARMLDYSGIHAGLMQSRCPGTRPASHRRSLHYTSINQDLDSLLAVPLNTVPLNTVPTKHK